MSDGPLLGLDIGNRRIGVAVTRPGVSIPQPLTTIVVAADDDGPAAAIARVAELVQEHGSVAVVAGWPRDMAGRSTEQTRTVEAFVDQLRPAISVPVHMQDEAVTSQKAIAELEARKKPYDKAEVDALAATYILEDYIQEHRPVMSRGHVL